MFMTNTDGSRWILGVTRQRIYTGDVARLVDSGNVYGVWHNMADEAESLATDGGLTPEFVELCQLTCDEMTYTFGGSGATRGILTLDFSTSAIDFGQLSALVSSAVAQIDRPNVRIVDITAQS